jgi:hypothetical protein
MTESESENNTKYSETTFYKIVCKDEHIKDIYVGHTTCFKKRMWQHKYSTNTPDYRSYNLSLYSFIRQNGGWENFQMVIIEVKTCRDKREAAQHETYLFNILGATLNSHVPSRSKYEYRRDNKDRIDKQMKLYRENNREIMAEKAKIYQQQTQICQFCNCAVKNGSRFRHINSKKHQTLASSETLSTSSESSFISH